MDSVKIVTNGTAHGARVSAGDALAIDKDETLARFQRAFKRARTADQVRALVARAKAELGYKKLRPILLDGREPAAPRTLTIKVATRCQRDLKATATRADVSDWFAANVATLNDRRIGQLLAYDRVDLERMVRG